jgi:predicted RNase H-like nuclease (RuvC/YqgF family)
VAILGIDIAAGGSFAYAVLEGKSIVEKGVLSSRELTHLFKRYRVEVLATDNIGELFQYGRPLVRLLGKLPYTVEVVEVTRGAGGYRKMEELVREHLGVVKGKLEPLETAEYLATLAGMGVGMPVKLFEEETVILVYRRISTSPGGMSRNRYMRNITHRIKSIASKIEAKLKEARLDYDLFLREESGEVTSAKFVVYANREVVRRYVKPTRGIDVAVAIYSAPAKRGKPSTRGRLLILGVDPGIVTGLAILTLDGEVLDTVARRSFSRGDVMRYVQQWGVPILVATDVAEAPEFVKRLAAMSGAVLYTPSRDLSSEEKTQILDKVRWQAKTSHERDALAAAYKAYLEYKPKFEKIEKEFGDILKFEQLEHAKALVVRGYSIAQAVSEALKKREEKETKVVYITVEKPCAARDEALTTRLKALEYENQQLQRELDDLRREYAQLRRYVEDEKWRDAKYREMQTRLETLTRELAKKDAEMEQLRKTLLEILMSYGSRYRLVHISQTAECRGNEPVGTICRNLSTVDEAVARRTLGVPLRQVVKLELGEFYVVDLDAVRELADQIRRRLDEKKEIDLRKLVEQYRRGLI